MENEYTPESVAQKIFSESVAPPCSNQLQLDEADNEYIFEMLISIFMEGVETKFGNLKQLDVSLLSTDTLMSLAPYVLSLGFKMNVKILPKEDATNYYCRILLNNEDNMYYFLLKSLEKNYTFVINNKKDIKRDNLKDYSAIFQKDDETFMISFDFHIPDVKEVIDKQVIYEHY
jgi:hypothetical protein